MKDIAAPFFALPFLAVISHDDMTFWERMLEKWGIGLIGMALFVLLARWTAKREEKAQLARDKKDAQDREERNALMARNNELQETLIAAVNSNARKFEQISKDGIKATEDHASSLKMLVRKMRCVAPNAFDPEPKK